MPFYARKLEADGNTRLCSDHSHIMNHLKTVRGAHKSAKKRFQNAPYIMHSYSERDKYNESKWRDVSEKSSAAKYAMAQKMRNKK